MTGRTHMKKRLLAMLMTLVMVLSILPSSVFARGTDDGTVEVRVGQWVDLEGVIHGEGDETWSVEDEEIAKVEDGRVYGLSAGETVVTHT